MGVFDQIRVPKTAGPKPMGFRMGSNADLDRAAPFRGLGSLGDILEMLNRKRRFDPAMSPSRAPSLPRMQQGGLVQQVIANRQRVLDSFTPNPYDQYQYLMDNPATRQAPLGSVTGSPSPETPVTSGSGSATMSPLEARIAELMGNRGMTQEEAAANQAFAAQQGADLNNDGAVTNAEYAQYLASREPTTATGVPAMPNPMGGGFLSSGGLQRAIDEYRASMAEQSGDMDMTPATPAVPEDLQDRIRALMGGSGMMGGMIPNIDVGRLRQMMADLYGGQTEQIRPAAVESTRPTQMMVDPRRMAGLL